MKYKLEAAQAVGGPVRKNGKPLNRFGNCFSVYSPVVGRNGSLITGFDHTEESKKVREKLEDELQLNRDDLKASSKYWNNFKITIPDSGVYLDDTSPLDKLKITVLKADPGVANSKTIYSNAPQSYLFLLTSEQIEAETKNTKRTLMRKAWGIYEGLTLNDKKDLLLLYGKGQGLLSNMTDAIVERELEDKIEENYSTFINLASDEKYKSKATIIKYVNKGVLTRGTAKKSYDQELLYNGESLGLTLNEVADFLLAKKNDKIRKAIELQYKGQ